ncbi:MAG: hypothetical protein JWO89_2324 [Verrucomicrobiaceae bacterium]|nr:hypothetical protein [Verrucomicrobiaceae bacterium]
MISYFVLRGSVASSYGQMTRLSDMTFSLRLFRPSLCFLVAACAVSGVSTATAQYQVALELNKKTYVSQEPMSATITVTNRSGADVILGGPNGHRWMTFTMKDSMDRALSPLDLTTEEPVILNAGATLRKKIRLSDTHSVQDQGTYTVTASVYHPPSGEYYQSNRARFVVTDIKPFGQPMMFGVPAGYPEAGRVRRYMLMVNREMDSSTMYFRMVDDVTGGKLATYPLGGVTLAREPQVTMDRNNLFHVMFMTNREVYTYAVIQPDGRPKSIQYLKDTPPNHPQLFLTASNEVVLKGGQVFDPNAKVPEATKGRSISERPPGL